MFTVNAANDDYPKTIEERRSEDIGSILGGEGIIFNPAKIKNESTKATIEKSKVSKYLWDATIETLNSIPLASIDSNSGIVVTDWYSPKNDPKTSFKISILIKDSVIGPESMDIKVFTKASKDIAASEELHDTKVALAIEDKILRRARELYIKSKR